MADQSKMTGDVEGALQYAYDRLATGQDARFRYHDLFHTFEDVMPAAVYLAGACLVTEEERQLLRIGVAFHDLGFADGPDNHEQRGVEIVAQVLPDLHFPPAAIRVVSGLILATRIPQAPTNLLEEIIADADLDILGRDDFIARNALLYRESVPNGALLSENDWLRQQIQFLRGHRYFTPAARDRRDAGKRQNLATLEEQIA